MLGDRRTRQAETFGKGRTLLLYTPRRREPSPRTAFLAPLVAAVLVALVAFWCAWGVAHGEEPVHVGSEPAASAATSQDAAQALGGQPAVNVAPLPTATPAPAFTATAEPVRVAPSSRGGRVLSAAEVRAIAADAFGEQLADRATSTAWCESRFDPSADSNYPYIGLWQIDPGLHRSRLVRLFGPGASLYSPTVNAAVAADILNDQGWVAWPVCRYAGNLGW